MTADPRQPRRGYGSLWRAVPHELGFLLLTMPIAIIGLSLLSPIFFSGIGMIVIVIGLFFVVASLWIARGFGTLELARLGASGRPPIARPGWKQPDDNSGFWRALLVPLSDGHYWVYLLHGLIVNPIVSVVSWSITITWTVTALAGVTYWAWAWSLPLGDRNFSLAEVVLEWMLRRPVDVDTWTLEIVFYAIIGVICTLTLPFITRGLTTLHHLIAGGMLSRWSTEDLAEQVTRLDASRGAAVSAEDQSLRRLERDIHDGPQQRLIRLQMDLAVAERKLSSDPESARALIAEANSQAHASLDELRALSRGFAPPILLDRGLLEAVRSTAAMSGLRVTVDSNLDASARLPGEIERNVYFVVAELIVNATKHSGATDVFVRLHISDPSPTGQQALLLDVSDNGRGGAVIAEGHGLAGLRDRITGLRGSFSVESPADGGTRVHASVPLP